MTYILAFGQPGLNAIIADSRVSWDNVAGEREGTNNALKIGVLFRGCIYGTVGSVSAAREFIRSFKESIHGSTDDGLGCWQKFERFVEQYPFPSSNSKFQLIISNRVFGAPRFALLDSTSGLDQAPIPHRYYLLAHGDGRLALNEKVDREFVPRLKELQQFLLEKNTPRDLIHRLFPLFPLSMAQ